jgi:hypothetical protein
MRLEHKADSATCPSTMQESPDPYVTRGQARSEMAVDAVVGVARGAEANRVELSTGTQLPERGSGREATTGRNVMPDGGVGS